MVLIYETVFDWLGKIAAHLVRHKPSKQSTVYVIILRYECLQSAAGLVLNCAMYVRFRYYQVLAYRRPAGQEK